MTEKKRGPWEIFSAAIMELIDWRDMDRHRLRDIEDRLASLDGGRDAAEASGAAYDATNADRRRTGKEPLGIKRP